MSVRMDGQHCKNYRLGVEASTAFDTLRTMNDPTERPTDAKGFTAEDDVWMAARGISGGFVDSQPIRTRTECVRVGWITGLWGMLPAYLFCLFVMLSIRQVEAVVIMAIIGGIMATAGLGLGTSAGWSLAVLWHHKFSNAKIGPKWVVVAVALVLDISAMGWALWLLTKFMESIVG